MCAVLADFVSTIRAEGLGLGIGYVLAIAAAPNAFYSARFRSFYFLG
jgi:hypothetical protein